MKTEITDEDLEKLARLHAAANGNKLKVEQWSESIQTDTSPPGNVGFCVFPADARSFAALHNAFPALLARLRASDERMKALGAAEVYERWAPQVGVIWEQEFIDRAADLRRKVESNG